MIGEIVAMGHHGGLGALGSTLAHAAVWSFVGRIVFHSPAGVAILIAAVAAAYIVATRRRSDG